MEQGTVEWLKWRHKGIGSSDVPVIMGVSPYKKAYKLFEEKILDEPPMNESNWAMEKGNQKEPIARAKMEIIFECELKPCLVEHDHCPFMRTSSDGANHEVKIWIEVKYVGKNFHEEIPAKYYPQLQYHHTIFGPEYKGYYVQITDDNLVHWQEVPADKDYIMNEMLPAVGKFWRMVQSKTWDIEDKLKEQLSEYEQLKIQLEETEGKLDAIKKEIFKATGPKFNYDRYTVNTVTKSGGIDYKKIVEEKLPDIDTSPYIKAGSTYKEIRIKKVAKEKDVG